MKEKRFVLLLVAFALFGTLILASCQSSSNSQGNGNATGSGAILEVNAERFSGPNDKVRVHIKTSAKTDLIVTLEDGSSKTRKCNNQCQIVFNKVSDASGTVTVSNGNDVLEASYPANQ